MKLKFHATGRIEAIPNGSETHRILDPKAQLIGDRQRQAAIGEVRRSPVHPKSAPIRPLPVPARSVGAVSAKHRVVGKFVSTAFQGKLGNDGDPDAGANDLFGCTSGVGGEIALVFLEPIRDQVTWNTTLPRNPDALLRAMVTVHEIGHEFGLDHIMGGAATSIMSIDASTIPDAEFYFSAKSINDLRNTSTSP